jgi:polyisoprenoid-binding protein YceI
MNKHMRNALKEKEFPQIHFQTDKYELEKNGGEAKALGELTIAGVTKPIELDATLTPVEGGVRATGKVDLQMKDFGVKPPSLLFGTLKVANEISVKFDSVIRPSGEVQTTALGNGK